MKITVAALLYITLKVRQQIVESLLPCLTLSNIQSTNPCPWENCKSDHSSFPKKQLRFNETCNLIGKKKYINVKCGVFRPFCPVLII